MAYLVLAGLRSESCQPEVFPSMEVSSKLDLQDARAICTQQRHQEVHEHEGKAEDLARVCLSNQHGFAYSRGGMHPGFGANASRAETQSTVHKKTASPDDNKP